MKFCCLILCLFTNAAWGASLWDQSLSAYQKGDFKTSRNILYHLVKKYPKKALYWFNLGNSYFMLNNYRAAETCFARVERLKSPLSPAARLYRSKALAALGKKDDARQILISLDQPQIPSAIRSEAKQDLTLLEDAHSEALSLYRQGKFKRALKLLEARTNLGEEDQLLKALVLIKLDRADEAQDLLRELKKSPSLEWRATVTELLDRIRESSGRKYWIFVEATEGYDTNVSQSTPAQEGVPASVDVGGGARLWTKNLWYVTSGYQLNFYNVPDHSDLQIIRHEIRSSLGREVASDLFLLTPHVAYETWGGTAAESLAGLSLKLRGGEKNWEYGLDSQFDLTHGESSTYSYLSGSTSTARIYVGRIKSPWYARVFIDWSRADIGDQTYSTGELLPSAYRSYSPGFRILRRIGKTWLTELSSSYTLRMYPTPAKNSGTKREDKDLQISPRLTYIFSNQFSVYIGGEFRNNTSTLTSSSGLNQNYTEWAARLGVLWDAL